MKKATFVIDHAHTTITMTKAYAKLANTPGTKEFRELAILHKTFPDYTICMRTAEVKDDKETHSGLTIARMETIIKQMVKDEEAQKMALDEYNEAISFYKGTKGYYGKMKKWFLEKYSNYQEIDFAA